MSVLVPFHLNTFKNNAKALKMQRGTTEKLRSPYKINSSNCGEAALPTKPK
jgi:hypothetical protein